MIKSNHKKVLIVFGTRPEVIKLAPVIQRMKQDSCLDVTVCSTGQHHDMVHSMLPIFDINLDYDLKVMQPGQDLFSLTSRILEGLQSVLQQEAPDCVVVQGDTTTAFAAALAASYCQIPVAHIEAGLRTYNYQHPFPEERNRVLISKLAAYHFAPTERNKTNLLKEGINGSNVFVSGNTVIDALQGVAEKLSWQQEWKNMFGSATALIQDKEKQFILVTGHRRESFGKGFENICQALLTISIKYPDMSIVYPVHLNPSVRKTVFSMLSVVDNIYLIEPLEYLPFVYLMQHCYLILTDSGGVQEEAPSLGKPVLVMRDTTERVEAIEAGTAKLVGTDHNRIVETVTQLIDDGAKYQKMACAKNPYGDGTSAQYITNVLKQECLKQCKKTSAAAS